MSPVSDLRSRRLHWSFGGPARVMGILNVTPDSFSDGGTLRSVDDAVARARQMLEAGAAMIDIGGESTRPGAPEVSVDEELRRVMPVIERVRVQLPAAVLSIDTMKPEVAWRALEAGVAMVNDVTGLRDAAMREVVRAAQAAACVMHMQGTPRVMQQNPSYGDVVTEVRESLRAAVNDAVAQGIEREALLVDPGICFGKTVEHNWQLLRRLGELRALHLPVVLGISRKSFLGSLLNGRPPEERSVAGTALAAHLAALGQVEVIRTHDVREVVDALAVLTQLTR